MARCNDKLPKAEVQKFFYHLCLALANLKTPKNAAVFLQDLLSLQEAEMIAKRLKIAELLIDGETYDSICRKIKVSPPTIARVQEWLKISGEGYRNAISATRKIKQTLPDDKFGEGLTSYIIKKRYPAYFWPQILVEDLIKNANFRQRRKIKDIIVEMERMKQKNELFKKIKKATKEWKTYK